MGKRRKKEEEEEQQAIEGLPNDLLREILSRVPYQSLCRSKCVSTAWLTLCSDPAVRRRSPQTLSGFFGLSHSGSNRFVNLSGRGRPLVDPSLPFLNGFESVKLLNCCGGILLCHGMRADGAQYIVCNPATEEIWAVLPVPDTHEIPRPWGYSTICLCFEPIVPSRFAVFVIIDNGHDITIMEVYSSDTGEWTSMSSRWGHKIVLYCLEPEYFFLNSTLHSSAYDSRVETFDSEGNSINMIVAVDTSGDTWRTTRQPTKAKLNFFGHSQGRLHGMDIDNRNGCRISVWVWFSYQLRPGSFVFVALNIVLLASP
ncbi:F-box protein At1g67130-like [Triticum dicoccoides]|uniref:F-box protein At1g67130-like n=1 Tax=Triticum dicoccoides TaxID=85692 RepID=UPI00188DF63C|nr:F-box protein At1g67130-like [Triticum dicoccoides]